MLQNKKLEILKNYFLKAKNYINQHQLKGYKRAYAHKKAATSKDKT